ncbi:MAG: dihydropteroate synthase [Armatimonadota bacterium]
MKNYYTRILSINNISDITDDLSIEIPQQYISINSTPIKINNLDSFEIQVLYDIYSANNADVFLSINQRDIIINASLSHHKSAIILLSNRCPELSKSIDDAIKKYYQTPILDVPHSKKLLNLAENMKERTIIMGILNVTPDSFSDGGQYIDADIAVKKAIKMAEDGADIIDIGGESTRPGSDFISTDEEISRVVPVIKALQNKLDIPISIDTWKSKVANEAINYGAEIINDISAGRFDSKILDVAAQSKLPYIIMHTKSQPKTMQNNPTYENLIDEVYQFLYDRLLVCQSVGINNKSIIIDPGFGFGKTVKHNLLLLKRLTEFKSLGRPILMGVSKKSTIGKVLGDLPIEERQEGTAGAVAVSILNGTNIVRVHDVLEMKRVSIMVDAVLNI